MRRKGRSCRPPDPRTAACKSHVRRLCCCALHLGPIVIGARSSPYPLQPIQPLLSGRPVRGVRADIRSAQAPCSGSDPLPSFIFKGKRSDRWQARETGVIDVERIRAGLWGVGVGLMLAVLILRLQSVPLEKLDLLAAGAFLLLCLNGLLEYRGHSSHPPQR